MELRRQALDVLQRADAGDKAAAALALGAAASGAEAQGTAANTAVARVGFADRRPRDGGPAAWIDTDTVLAPGAPLPGRPPRPNLVAATRLPRRSAFTREGRAGLLHAVAHIEFNAINLALDAVWRFPGLPADYYRQWLQVAADEALHFTMLCGHLETLGCRYGDFDAHDGLWSMVERTAGDVVARMALVPRTLEARGLDATPPMQARLARAGDSAAVAILARILHDEIGHVAVGNHWYLWLCRREGLDPVPHAAALALRYGAPRPRPPFNAEARRAAGFSQEEIDALAGG